MVLCKKREKANRDPNPDRTLRQGGPVFLPRRKPSALARQLLGQAASAERSVLAKASAS